MSVTEAADVLTRGELTVKGRLPWSSNATLLVEATLNGATTLGVYKPERGERPLWDFPRGLYRRELAAWHLSEALGWGLVPLTVARDGPWGQGSVQLFVAADFEQHYFTLREDARHHDRLRRICAFDLITNNADRKSGHCLLGEDGTIYAIDNGLCFHVEPKLRTVIWEFADEPLPAGVLDDLKRLAARPLPAAIRELIAAEECAILLKRTRALVKAARFPTDALGHGYPWPLVLRAAARVAHEPYLPATDMPRFVRELAEFVGFDDAEAAIVRRTAPLVLARGEALTAALYEHFLRFPASARFFLGPDGEPDRARIERRRHSLTRWLRETAEAALTHEHAYYLLTIGLSHSHRPHGPGGVVAPHFMVGAMSLTQSALADAFAADLPPAAALEASRAWNKLLLVHLAALLLGYLPARAS